MADQVAGFEKGRRDAEDESVVIWWILGFMFGVITLAVVYLRDPKMSLIRKASISGDHVPMYEAAYLERLKERQVRATWIGLAIGFTALMVSLVLIGIIADVAS